jgi:ABC-2 type transport system permease protein
MTSIASTFERPTARLAPSTLLVARRALLRYLRTPQLIVLGTLQMSGFMLVYRYVFGGVPLAVARYRRG